MQAQKLNITVTGPFCLYEAEDASACESVPTNVFFGMLPSIDDGLMFRSFAQSRAL